MHEDSESLQLFLHRFVLPRYTRQMIKMGDNFVGLRLAAATLVMVGHIVILDHPVGGPISETGLLMLFSISGYLVAASWRSDPHLVRFLLRRFLRIWPAYATMILICAALAYPSRPSTALAFVKSLWFEYHAVGINGSIWMMPIEMGLYLLLALAATGKTWSLVALSAFAAWMTQFFGVGWADFGIFFVAGLLLQAYPRVKHKVLIFCTIGATALVAGLSELATVLMIPVATVWMGTRSWPALRSAGRLGDLSYGIFLWHAPLLHFVVVPIGFGLPFNILATAVSSSALALLSWHTIERPSLRVKPRPSSLVRQPLPDLLPDSRKAEGRTV